jgi:predicted CoA-binding protein
MWMPFINPSDDRLRTLLGEATTIAIVGASGNPERPAYGVMQHLQQAGYRIIPVNPRESTILGEPCYAALAAIPMPVDIVDVFRKPEETPAIADEAVGIGAKALWLQSGIANDAAAARAQAAGLTVVMDACIAVTQRRLAPAAKGPSGNKCGILGVEAPESQGARRDASAAKMPHLFPDGP